MGFGGQLLCHPYQNVWTDILQSPWCPLLLFTMQLGHVAGICRDTGISLARDLVLALIRRIDSPAASRRRRISRILRIVRLIAGITTP